MRRPALEDFVPQAGREGVCVAVGVDGRDVQEGGRSEQKCLHRLGRRSVVRNQPFTKTPKVSRGSAGILRNGATSSAVKTQMRKGIALCVDQLSPFQVSPLLGDPVKRGRPPCPGVRREFQDNQSIWPAHMFPETKKETGPNNRSTSHGSRKKERKQTTQGRDGSCASCGYTLVPQV